MLRACAHVGGWRSTARHRSRRRDPAELVGRLRELALARPRWGYRMLGDLLRDEGHVVNHRRLFRSRGRPADHRNLARRLQRSSSS